MTKLKVRKEGRDGVYLVEKKDIKKYIIENKIKTIHNFIPSGLMVLGANHDQKSVLADIDKADRLGILTGKAQQENMRHALSLISDNGMEMYDIGKLEDEDLIIIDEDVKKEELRKKLIYNEMEGYILGLDRSYKANERFVSHIYKGSFHDPEKPMCKRGWNRDNGTGFSIWRNNLGKGICKVCLKNTLKEINQPNQSLN